MSQRKLVRRTTLRPYLSDTREYTRDSEHDLLEPAPLGPQAQSTPAPPSQGPPKRPRLLSTANDSLQTAPQPGVVVEKTADAHAVVTTREGVVINFAVTTETVEERVKCSCCGDTVLVKFECTRGNEVSRHGGG